MRKADLAIAAAKAELQKALSARQSSLDEEKAEKALDTVKGAVRKRASSQAADIILCCAECHLYRPESAIFQGKVPLDRLITLKIAVLCMCHPPSISCHSRHDQYKGSNPWAALRDQVAQDGQGHRHESATIPQPLPSNPGTSTRRDRLHPRGLPLLSPGASRTV